MIFQGPEIDSGDFITKMYPRDNAPSEFDYPEDRLYELYDILSVDDIRHSNVRDHNNDPVRYVLGPLNSIEVAIFPYDNNSGTERRCSGCGRMSSRPSTYTPVAISTSRTLPSASSHSYL